MLDIQVIRKPGDFNKNLSRDEFIEFLYDQLGEFGDSKEAISSSIEYAFSSEKGKGGYLLAAYEHNELVGALVMNFTGMSQYIPKNILVYVAVHKDHRGKGLGSKIVNKAKELCDGNIALHVEYHNPAKRLYERLGFKSKYAEMRYENK
ncbi:MAG: GNAT family N-acetyltransferase [Candidatus Cloacimonadota bacterium]|nr:GNAT family N-acetyltransferase [Candidatus Cloacimonadota bacterium]